MRHRPDHLSAPSNPAQSLSAHGEASPPRVSRGVIFSLVITQLQRLMSRFRSIVEPALWSVTSPRLYLGLAALAWLGALYAPELRAYYIEAHPELRAQVEARVAAEWGARHSGRLALVMSEVGGRVPQELRLHKPEGVVYLSGSGAEGCIGALVRPRVVLSSARCVDRVQPTFASWGSTLGEELIKLKESRRAPSGSLVLLKLERVAPLPALRVLRDERALLAQGRPVAPLTKQLSSAQDSRLSSGYAGVFASIERRRLPQRDALNAVLYLSVYESREGARGARGPAGLRKAALWVPQRSERDPSARSRALRALSAHPGGALMISRSRALEAISTRDGLIPLATHYRWILETSEALSARAARLKRERT